MKLIIWQVICLLCCSAAAYSQSIWPEELVKLRKASPMQIDSTMKAKGFRKVAGPLNDSVRSVGYFYQAVEEEVKVQRLLIASWDRQSRDTEVEYDLWQDKDANNWMDRLLKAGFKRPEHKFPDVNSPKHFKAFHKNGNLIYCNEEMDNHSGRTRYRFTISKNYKGDTL